MPNKVLRLSSWSHVSNIIPIASNGDQGARKCVRACSTRSSVRVYVLLNYIIMDLHCLLYDR
jgi:hypothetical protein